MPADVSVPTMVLSVVAVDLVAYSKKSVAEQVTLKDNFNKLLLRALTDIAVTDRIILDTGDGVAIGFLGDPEDALYVAMFMHLAINRGAAKSQSSTNEKEGGKGAKNSIRIGINLGPVKLAGGIGGHPNIIGDGINVAERIMSFAEPGQLTASRSFYEVMSRSSGPYTTLFQLAGQRTDSQLRAHDVYLVGKSVLAFQQAEMGVAERAARRTRKPEDSSILPAAMIRTFPAPSAEPPVSALTGAVADPQKPLDTASASTNSTALIDFLEDRQKVAATASALGIVAVILAAVLGYRLITKNSAPVDVPAFTSASPDSVSKDVNTTEAPRPPTVVAARDVPKVGPSALPPKAESVPSKSIPPASPPPVVPIAPKATMPSTTVAAPTKPAERIVHPEPAPVAPPKVVREPTKEPKAETRVERNEPSAKSAPREDTRSEPRKPTPRGSADRAPPTNAPYVPSYPSPTEAPRPEPVAPTPAPVLPPPSTDTEAVVVSRTAPSYPVEGIRQGITSGFVRARLTIDANGNVSNVNILEARPIVAFGRETRLTLKTWKFNPGVAGRTYDIELTFKP